MAEGRLNPREQARLEEKKKSRKTRAKYIAVAAVLVVMIALVVFVNSTLFTDGLAALKVGDTKYTVADVNYQYQNSYQQFYQSYGNYISMFFDTEKPLSEQDCMFMEDGGTWDDYFKENAETTLTELTAYYNAARQAGYELTEEEQAQIDNVINTYSLYASMYGYEDADGFIAANFGAGNSEKTLRRNMGKQVLVERYLNDIRESFQYTPEELDAYYEENINSLGRVDFLYKYTAAAEGVNAEEISENILKAMEGTDEEAFRAAVLSVTETEATSSNTSPNAFISQYAPDRTAEDLQPGAVFTHTTDAGSYALYVIGMQDQSYNTVNVRHILIMAEDADENGEYSEEELAAARESIENIRDEWLAGEATEEEFARLAGIYTEDSGSADNGGLYENIYKGQMVSEFDAFCFSDHEPGDYDIVHGESASYNGYHLVYYIGQGDVYSRTLADSEMRDAAYNEMVGAMTQGLTAQRTFMWRYVSGN